MRSKKFLAAAGAFALTAALAACGGSTDGGSGSTNGGGNSDSGTAEGGVTKLSMGVVPTDTMTETFNQWSFLIGLLEEDTGYEIELYEASDLPAVIEAAVAGDLDIIYLGPFGHLIARQNGAEMSTVGASSATPAGVNNASMGVVRADSPVQDLADLEGEDICFVSPSSATGYLFGAAGLVEIGLDPERDVNPIFVGDHSSAARAMYDGECAAVFTTRSQAETEFYKDNPDVSEGDIRVFWTADVPEGGVAISTQLPEEVQDKLRAALLELNGTNVLADGRCPDDRVVEGDDGEFCGVWNNQWWGLEEVDDTYWEPIREVCEATNAPACAG